MHRILRGFQRGMGSVRDNFKFSLLALKFFEQRPFAQDIILRINESKITIPAKKLNDAEADVVRQYVNSIRRHLLNDMVIVYERYSTLMMASHDAGQVYVDPSLAKKLVWSHQFESLPNVYTSDDLQFFQQLRHLRHSVVHYNGVYNACNKLDYTFGTETFVSQGNEGKGIEVSFDTLLSIWQKLLHTVERGNRDYLRAYPTS